MKGSGVSPGLWKRVKAGVGTYLVHTNSVADPVRGTSVRQWYGANRGLIPLGYVSDCFLGGF